MSELKFSIPPGTPSAKCRSCQATIYWIETTKGKQMPCNGDGTSHFASCPNADEWRKPSAQKALFE